MKRKKCPAGIGERIKKRRLELNMTQKHLAELVGYKNGASIYMIESGRSSLSFSRLCDFAKALGVKKEDLLGRDLEKSEKKTLAREKDARHIREGFSPRGTYPSVEYIHFLKWQIDFWNDAELLDGKVGLYEMALEDKKYAAKAMEKLRSLDQFWLSVLDVISTGNKEAQKRLGEKERRDAKDALRHPTGIVKEIYEDFCKTYSLGKYRREVCNT